MACASPLEPLGFYDEIRRAWPYRDLQWETFERVIDFVATGGYALAAYERHRKLFQDSEGRMHVRSARIAAQHRMNIGTIVEAPLLKVRLAGKRGAESGG
jgi:ATP-dependent Lhr-like helicase